MAGDSATESQLAKSAVHMGRGTGDRRAADGSVPQPSGKLGEYPRVQDQAPPCRPAALLLQMAGSRSGRLESTAVLADPPSDASHSR